MLNVFAVRHKRMGEKQTVIVMAGNEIETQVKAELFSSDMLFRCLRRLISTSSRVVATYSYDSEAADIRAGFDVNAADLKRAIAGGEEIASGVLDFLKRVIALPFEPDDYFFYAEKRI